MNPVRLAAWTLVLTAAVMSGPTIYVQALTALREIVGTAARLVREKFEG